LGLEQVHLLGQSWGGWLAIEYMLSHPQGVVGLILASTSASLRQFIAETSRLKAGLPLEIYQTLKRYEAMRDYHHPAYEAAVLEFYKRHVCRLDPWPEPLLRTITNLNGNAVYETMNGPNEFIVIGNLKAWDRTDRLGEISVPTLVTVGRYDELTPSCAETLHRGIPNSRIVIFEQSAHLAHLEEPDKYRQVVADFMVDTETPAHGLL
jgi:proline-specific peptidase